MPQLSDKWFDRDLPALIEIVRQFDSGHGSVRPAEISQGAQLSDEATQQALASLARDGLIDTRSAMGGHVIVVTAVSGRAHTITGLWPTPETALTRLVDLLESRLAAATTDDERGRLRKAYDGIKGLGPALGVEVVGTFLGNSIS